MKIYTIIILYNFLDKENIDCEMLKYTLILKHYKIYYTLQNSSLSLNLFLSRRQTLSREL